MSEVVTAVEATKEPSTLLVVAMGMITVFVVLICLILIIKLLGAIMVKVTANSAPAATPVAAPAPDAAPVTGDKQKLVAAIAAAIAEDMGTDVNHLKIHSIRKL